MRLARRISRSRVRSQVADETPVAKIDRVIPTRAVKRNGAAKPPEAAPPLLPHSYRALVERIPDIVYAAAVGAQGAWLYASPQIESTLGYTPEEWCAEPALWFERLHPEDRERAIADEAQSQETGELDSEYRMIARDGRVIWVHDRATLLHDEPGSTPYFQGVMIDITDRKRTEVELAFRSEELAKAQRLAQMGSWEWDLEADRVTWSDELYRIFGVRRETFVPSYESYLAVVHPEDRAFVESQVERRLAEKQPIAYECRIVRPGGELRVLHANGEVTEDETGKVVKMRGTAQDVTEERRFRETAERSLALTDAVVRSALDCVITIDADGIVHEFNPAAERTFGYDRAEVVGRELAELIVPPASRERHRAGLRHAAETGEGEILGRRTEVVATRADGSEIPVELAITRISGEPARFAGFLRDISDQKKAESALVQSHHQLQSIIDNSPSVIYAKDRALRYLFVNAGFERVFELEPGAAIGQTDESILPARAAERARSIELRVLETGEVVEHEEVHTIGGETRTFLDQRFPLRDSEGHIYAVCGISTDISERKAEAEELRAEIGWSNRVREAVARDRLVLHVQPILNLRSGTIDQEELLVRMHGDRGADDLIMPGQFLPAAERFGLVHEIDRWVVFQAVKLARQRKIEVNLSGKSIGDATLINLVQAGLRSHGTDPANLVFEITETAAAENLKAAAYFVQRLTDMGCGFALDDFGTGFGSFNYLKHLPVQYLKIDMEFVRDLERDPSDQKVVRSIVQVAAQFGMSTIAEGVERQETLELLRELGVHFAQGYLIGRPSPL
jgi:PAS domain S-box-containing protein